MICYRSYPLQEFTSSLLAGVPVCYLTDLDRLSRYITTSMRVWSISSKCVVIVDRNSNSISVSYRIPANSLSNAYHLMGSLTRYVGRLRFTPSSISLLVERGWRDEGTGDEVAWITWLTVSWSESTGWERSWID